MFLELNIEKDHSIIKPENYFLESNNLRFLLTRPCNIYHDKQIDNLFISNTVFIPSNEVLFKIEEGQLQFNQQQLDRDSGINSGEF